MTVARTVAGVNITGEYYLNWFATVVVGRIFLDIAPVISSTAYPVCFLSVVRAEFGFRVSIRTLIVTTGLALESAAPIQVTCT